jgi:hypothetical protein
MQHGEVIETLEHQTVNGIDDLGQTRKNLTKNLICQQAVNKLCSHDKFETSY